MTSVFADGIPSLFTGNSLSVVIQSYYVACLGRPADAGGLDYWQQVTSATQGQVPVLDAIVQSVAFQAEVAQGGSHLVNWVLGNMFGHAASAGLVDAWAPRLDSGAATPAEFVQLLFNYASFDNLGREDATAWRNKLIAAQAFTAAADLRSEIIVIDGPRDPDGKLWLAGVGDTPSLNTALGNLYETMTADVPDLFPIRAGQHLSAKTGVALVQEMYIGFFGRPADQAGLSYWTERLQHGAGADEVRAAFAQSTEFQALSKLSYAQLVDALYQHDFGHAPDEAGRTYWIAALDHGSVSTAGLVEALATGATGADAEILRAKLVAASALTAALPLQGDIAYIPENPPPPLSGSAFLADVTGDAALDTVLDNLVGTLYSHSVLVGVY